MGQRKIPYTILRHGIYFFNWRCKSLLVRLSLHTRDSGRALLLAVNLRDKLTKHCGQTSQIDIDNLKRLATEWLRYELNQPHSPGDWYTDWHTPDCSPLTAQQQQPHSFPA